MESDWFVWDTWGGEKDLRVRQRMSNFWKKGTGPQRRPPLRGQASGARAGKSSLSATHFVTIVSALGLVSFIGMLRALSPQRYTEPNIESRRSGACGLFKLEDHFGTKSIYSPPDEVAPLDPDGVLLYVYILARHGCRFPTKKNVHKIAELHEALIRTGTSHSPAWLFHLSNPYTMELAGALTERGARQMRDLGARFWNLYGVEGGLHSARVESTFKERAVESAKSFASSWYGGGFQGAELAESVFVHPRDPRDSTLRFFECAPYNEYRATLMIAREKDLSPYRELAMRITKALSLRHRLEPSMARVVLHSCMYDVARDVKNSHFCDLIGEQDALKVERFVEDQESFKPAAIKFPWVAAPVLIDIIESMKMCLSQSSKGQCTETDIRVAHAETLMPLVLLLGLGKTEQVEGEDELCSAGTFCPMGANLAIELYRTSNRHTYVMFRLNERYVKMIDKCGNKDFCTLEELESILKHTTTMDEWERRCHGTYNLPKDYAVR
uniref:Multiple inositol polyphosphate phosphatase 1 n=1 Tax=Rhodosorus marinus TaxID=101924 RepID=A0A7S0BSA4_9RHOD|mmetsp:Transcript_6371/g.9061  ORF Transcript_6371/g.9061 Transcript_6371/m.9061 type:complete len:498 (+) Transcript_6371:375-1868(+)